MTDTHDVDTDVRELRRARARLEVDRLDYVRLLRKTAQVRSQVVLAGTLKMSQAAVSKQLSRAQAVPDPLPGFSGASPYEIAQRHAAGELDHAQVVDELGRWPYDATATSDGWDSLIVDAPGTHTFDEVVRALDEDLIDEDTYDEVIRRLQANG
jgi:hypothetical protein